MGQPKDTHGGRARTGLQGGQWLRLLAELTVPNVIGRLHAELVGCEGLKPVGRTGFSEQRYLCSGKGAEVPIHCTDRNIEAQEDATRDKQGPGPGGPELPGCPWTMPAWGVATRAPGGTACIFLAWEESGAALNVNTPSWNCHPFPECSIFRTDRGSQELTTFHLYQPHFLSKANGFLFDLLGVEGEGERTVQNSRSRQLRCKKYDPLGIP